MDKKKIGILAACAAAVCIIVFGGIYLTRNIGKSDKVISEEKASSKLTKRPPSSMQRSTPRRKRPGQVQTAGCAKWQMNLTVRATQ